MGNLDGKVAIVTGAGRGIGQQIAKKLAEAGAKVAVVKGDEGAAAKGGRPSISSRRPVRPPSRSAATWRRAPRSMRA